MFLGLRFPKKCPTKCPTDRKSGPDAPLSPGPPVMPLAQTPASSPPDYRVADSTAAVARMKPSATAQCLRRTPSLLPRRRCATAPASDEAARRLAACRRLPRRGCHHASAHEAAPWLCLFRYRRPASADFLLSAGVIACCPPPAQSATPTASAATASRARVARTSHRQAGVNSPLRVEL